MHPKRNVAQIARIAEDIRYIAADFEAFGGIFLDTLLGISMNHRGTNMLGFPVARVIDSDSTDGTVAAQYSAEKGYFDGQMQKAEGDLLKVLKHAPTVDQIYLLSHEPKRPQVAEVFEARMRSLPEMEGRSLHLWGSEEIAGKIVEILRFNDTAIARLARYLPSLQRIVDEEAASNIVRPPDRPYIDRAVVDAEITRHLEASPALAISGLGGRGKSAAAAAYWEKHKDEYDIAIWLEGSEVVGATSLHAIPLSRGGEQRNVAALLRTRACLLIIDDAALDLALDKLTPLCGPGSHIILTRRNIVPPCYELPMFDEEEATQLLNQDVDPCPDDVFALIWKTVGGHPLTLGLMNAAVRQGAPWSDIVSDCQAVGELEDGTQRLADRLLGRLRPLLERELSVFAWAEQASCDRDFLISVVQPAGLRKLGSNGLLSVDRPEISRLHDIIFATLSSDEWCSGERRQQLDASLENYLLQTASNTDLRFWTAARMFKSKLEGLVPRGNGSVAFRYALLSIWDTGEFRPDLIPDPVAEAESLRGTEPAPLAVPCVIEAIEQLFLHDKKEGHDIAAERLQSRLVAFDVLAGLPGLTDLEVAQIQHHLGKALKRLGQTDEAAVLLEQVLAGPVPMNETRLQLIDVYRVDREKTERAVALVDEILTQSINSSEVSYSVFLGAIERLPWGGGSWRSELIRRHAEAIEETIVEAAERGIQQAYQTFGAIGRYLSTEAPDLFASIFAKLTKPAPASLQSDNDKSAWGEIYFEASRLPDMDAAQLREVALSFYEAELAPQPFHRQRHSELLIDMGRAAEAEEMLRARDDLEQSVWLQRLMARARFAQGEPADALLWIDRALEGLTAEHFRSEFLELRHSIGMALGHKDAVADLERAIELSQKENERFRLLERLRRLGTKSP